MAPKLLYTCTNPTLPKKTRQKNFSFLVGKEYDRGQKLEEIWRSFRSKKFHPWNRVVGLESKRKWLQEKNILKQMVNISGGP